MAYSFTLTETAALAGNSISKSNAVTGSLSLSLSEVCPDSAATPFTIAIDVSALKAIILVSDQAVSVDGDTPFSSPIVLVPNVPYIWTTNSYNAKLLTADVAVLTVTNASGDEANFELRAIVDATP